MLPRRLSPIVTALMLGAIAVSAHAATIQITMENLVISPAEASAKVGDTIEWINKDIFVHTATARNGDLDVTMPPKKTVTSGFEEGRHGRVLLPLPSQHEGRAYRCAVARQSCHALQRHRQPALPRLPARPDRAPRSRSRLERVIDRQQRAGKRARRAASCSHATASRGPAGSSAHPQRHDGPRRQSRRQVRSGYCA